MKLISCYIENFGGLSGYTLDFSEGVTVIHAPNGFGKTTLAEFLRAMFYGFPRKAKTLEKSRRQKYAPWGGGSFGGNLVFEHEGRSYRLERTFGATPRSDSFALIDLETGRKSSRFSEEIGQELFQLDADSFERSTYLPQIHDHGSLTTAGIQAKLADLVEDTGDIGNFDKAMAALKNRRSSYIPYRGSGGSVTEASAQITRLQRELDSAKDQEEQLEQCAGAIRDTQRQIEEKTALSAQKRTQWQQAVETETLRKQRDDLRVQRDRWTAELEELQRRYPGGIPDPQALDAARVAADELAALDTSGLSDRERLEAVRLRGAFDAGMLDEARLDRLAEQNRQLLRQQAVLDHLTGSEENKRAMTRLEGYFAGGIPETEEISRHLDALARCAQLRRKNAELSEEQKSGNPLLLILGLVLLAAGVVLQLLEHSAAAFLGGGAALLAAGFIQYRKRSVRLRTIRRRIAEREAMIREAEQSAREFAARYSEEADPDAALDEIRRFREELAHLQEAQRLLEEKRREQKNRIWQMEVALCDELESDDFEGAIAQLRLDRSRVLAWMAREKPHSEKRTALEAKLREILIPWGLSPETDLRGQLQRMRDDRKTWENAAAREKELSDRLRQLPEIPAGSADSGTLKARWQQLDKEVMQLQVSLAEDRQLLDTLRSRTARIPELTDELQHWQDCKVQRQRSAAILDDTMEFLSAARESLNTGYMAPIRDSFDAYMTRLTSGQRETAFISPDLQVQLERQGQSRELAYFSAGQTDLVMLCMRFALVDALFRDAKPFIILDDPFVNLDDARTAEALRLLENLGKDRQIIYLTCSRSRMM